MIRLHLNENPFCEDGFNRYPDQQYDTLRTKIKAYHNLRQSEVLLGNGSTEIINQIFLWAHINRKTIVYLWPSYILYKELEDIFQTNVIRQSIDFRVNGLDFLVSHLPENALLVLCNPNNPTGGYIKKQKIRELLKAIPASTTVLIDEAYIEYVTDESECSFIPDVETLPNLIVVRTFSKYFGLAGLRIGYAVMSNTFYRMLRPLFQPWNVNVQAQSKAEECLSQSAFYEEQKRKVLMIKDNARRIMEEWGFTVLPSSTNFLCSTHKNIESYKQRWRQMNIAVNELSAYQSTWLHNYVRISMEDEDKIDLFIQSVCKNAVHI